jgi:hypothetical protein
MVVNITDMGMCSIKLQLVLSIQKLGSVARKMLCNIWQMLIIPTRTDNYEKHDSSIVR